MFRWAAAQNITRSARKFTTLPRESCRRARQRNWKSSSAGTAPLLPMKPVVQVCDLVQGLWRHCLENETQIHRTFGNPRVLFYCVLKNGGECGIISETLIGVQIRIFRGELVYNKLGKDEIIVSISLFIFALVYRILEDYQVNMIPSDLALLVLMICTAYLCFNRVVKLLINRNKNNFYCTSAVIQSTKYIPAGRGSYICYVIKYYF